jgi:hypothetical protein
MNKQKEEKNRHPVRVFVSYAKEDSAFANKLLSYLSNQPRLDIFTTNKISAGEKWRSKIKSALNASDIFLVVLSPASVKSTWVLFELGVAWGLDMPIIPVATHPDVISKVPVELKNVPVINLEDLKNLETMNQILKDCEKVFA